jgi:uncharacterized DUF497 family protein
MPDAIDFTRDPRKATSNASEHRVEFSEAATVFDDPLALAVFDAHTATTKTVGSRSAARRVVDCSRCRTRGPTRRSTCRACA